MGQYECSVCGHDVSRSSNYCEKCGARLGWQGHPPPSPEEAHNEQGIYIVPECNVNCQQQPYYNEEAQKTAVDIMKKVAVVLLVFVILFALLVFGLIFGATCRPSDETFNRLPDLPCDSKIASLYDEPVPLHLLQE